MRIGVDGISQEKFIDLRLNNEKADSIEIELAKLLTIQEAGCSLSREMTNASS